MRTAEEVRTRHLGMLGNALRRPGMWGGDAHGIELLLQRLLDDLCYIDGRDRDWAATIKYRRGCRGVCGQLEFQHRFFPDYVNEVASSYAEVAFSLGFFIPGRLLPPDEMSRLRRSVTREFMAHDRDERQLHAKFGEPSHEVLGGDTTVACYACSKPHMKWVFFDLSRRNPGAGDDDWFEIPRVRDVRKGLGNRMHLLPFGKRWVNGKLA